MNVDQFALAADDNGVLTFQREASNGVASKWEHRDSALVLIPKTTLPADAHLKIVCEKTTATVYANYDGHFIYSMPKDSEETITVSLISSLLPAGTTVYDFDVNWFVAESQVEQSPMNTQDVATTELMLSCKKVEAVSLKITGDKKLYSVGDTVKANISWADLPQSHILEVVLMVKTADGEYSSTGVSREINFTNETGTMPIEISLAGNSAGSYCLQLAADQGLISVAEARDYFIVQ